MRESRFNISIARGDKVYLYNGVSGYLLKMPSRQYHSLQNALFKNEYTGCSPKLLALLAEGLMLLPDDTDELELLAARYRAGQRDATTFAITIVTSLGCNFDCTYCFEDKRSSIISKRVQRAILAVLSERLRTIKRFHVSWYGGEPLLCKNNLLSLSDDFINQCDPAGVSYSASITTNGYLLNEATCTELCNRRVTSAQVTLDGPPRIHDLMRPLANGKGTFWQIVNNLKHAIECLNISVRVNLHKHNFKYVEELFEILSREGVAKKVIITPGQIVDCGQRESEQHAALEEMPLFNNREFADVETRFYRLAKEYGFPEPLLPSPINIPCGAASKGGFVVGSEGELYKCWESVGDSREIVGHISNCGEPTKKLDQWVEYSPLKNPECRNCAVLPTCMGGCANSRIRQRDIRDYCNYFRYNHVQRIISFVESANPRSHEVNS